MWVCVGEAGKCSNKIPFFPFCVRAVYNDDETPAPKAVAVPSGRVVGAVCIAFGYVYSQFIIINPYRASNPTSAAINSDSII